MLAFNYAPSDLLHPHRISSALSWVAYAAGTALLVAVPFTLALEWLRATGRDVPSKMSWGALMCGASFGSPVAVITWPPALTSQLFGTFIVSALYSRCSRAFCSCRRGFLAIVGSRARWVQPCAA